MTKFAAAALAGLSVLSLSACATGTPAQVSRYQAMPAPQGQSFFIVAANPAMQGTLEFNHFASLVAQAMQAQGYVPASAPQQASMLVRMAYGVDRGRTEYVQDPIADPYWGRPYYSPWGYYGPRSPFYYGWNDPFAWGYGSRWGLPGPFNDYVTPVTVFQSFLDLDIRRPSDNAQLFGGHAQARSETNNLGTLVPNLVTAMFTGFPGRSGETVRIIVPPMKRPTPRS